MRLIDKDALIEAIREEYFLHDNRKLIIRLIEQQPSAKPEIIRCKDCKYIEEHHYENAGDAPYIKYTCKHKAGLADGYQVHDWDFCSRAERVDNE